MPLGDHAADLATRVEPRAHAGSVRYLRREIPLVSAETHLTGRCTNDLFCMAAIRKDDVFVLPGNAFVCPSCQKPLAARATRSGRAPRPRTGQARRAAMPLVSEGKFVRGRCLNHRRCSVARSENLICVRVGNVFVCPECSRPLSAGIDLGRRVLTPLVCSIGAGLLLLGTSAAVLAMQSPMPALQAIISTGATLPDDLMAPPSLSEGFATHAGRGSHARPRRQPT